MSKVVLPYVAQNGLEFSVKLRRSACCLSLPNTASTGVDLHWCRLG